MSENRFMLAMMIAKRVKQLKHGEKPLIKTKQLKHMAIALEEITQGKVFVKKEVALEDTKTEEIFDESFMDE